MSTSTIPTTIKLTPTGQSYWNDKGAFQAEYNELYEKHVPRSGSCSTLNGELIRAASRLSYEYYNNGNCNSKSGRGVSKYYRQFLNLIAKSNQKCC
jgi:hypothetical protein